MDLREIVRLFLRDSDEWESNRLAHREELRTRGLRLVCRTEVGHGKLELRDAVTDDLLFLGNPDDGMRQWKENWADVDKVDGEIELTMTSADGVPQGLQDHIRDWVDENLDAAREFAE